MRTASEYRSGFLNVACKATADIRREDIMSMKTEGNLRIRKEA